MFMEGWGRLRGVEPILSIKNDVKNAIFLHSKIAKNALVSPTQG